MLNIFNLLPLMKGWEYRTHIVEDTIAKGQTVEKLRLDELGWLMELAVVTYDAYGGVIVQAQGADLQPRTLQVYPASLEAGGAIASDPAGWVPRYLTNDPSSTAGLFFTDFTPGFAGFGMPYVPTIVISLRLWPNSTQSSAYIGALALVVAITKKEAFIRSLRRILGAQTDLWIDPGLLTQDPSPEFIKFREFKEPPRNE